MLYHQWLPVINSALMLHGIGELAPAGEDKQEAPVGAETCSLSYAPVSINLSEPSVFKMKGKGRKRQTKTGRKKRKNPEVV